MVSKLNKLVVVGSFFALTSVVNNAYAAKNGETFKSWKVQCEKVKELGDKEICGITQTVLDKDKNPVVNIGIRKVKNNEKPIAHIKVPLRVNLQGGVGISVDKKELAQVPYLFCDQSGCDAIVPLEDKIVSAMKSGKKLEITVWLVDKKFEFEASLSGFGSALKSL